MRMACAVAKPKHFFSSSFRKHLSALTLDDMAILRVE